jgi:putative ABC transport system permease protein
VRFKFRLFLRLLGESSIFALQALWLNKLRTFLSVLGITIGIFSIITVFTVVDSLEKNVRESVESLGNDVVFIQKWPWIFGPNYPFWKYMNRPAARLSEYAQLAKSPNIAGTSCLVINWGNRTLKYNNSNVTGINIIAATHEYDKVRNFEFEKGRYFTQIESEAGRNNIILGSKVAEGLFGTLDPIGKQVLLKGLKMRVIGVLKKEGESLLEISMDNVAMIPYVFALKLIGKNNDRLEPTIMVKADDNVPLEFLESELRGKMRSIRKLSPREEDDFALNKITLISQQLTQTFKIINVAGGIIGLFSILVGGFGIANIMFVSVKERTNIIGIQKSLGAKNYFILLQFLVEAIVLSLIGGLMGLLLVFLGTFAASSVFGFAVTLSMSNIIVGVSVSAIIGLVSGFIPAWSASRLDPVDAIRSK